MTTATWRNGGQNSGAHSTFTKSNNTPAQHSCGNAERAHHSLKIHSSTTDRKDAETESTYPASRDSWRAVTDHVKAATGVIKGFLPAQSVATVAGGTKERRARECAGELELQVMAGEEAPSCRARCGIGVESNVVAVSSSVAATTKP